MLVRLAEAIASPSLRDLALGCYGHLQAVIAHLPEIASFYGELFSIIDSRCKHWVFVSNNKCLDVVIFWQGMKDKVWKTRRVGWRNFDYQPIKGIFLLTNLRTVLFVANSKMSI